MSTITIDVVVRDQAAAAAMKNMGDQITKSQKRWSTFGVVAGNAITKVAGFALKAGGEVVKFGADSVKAASDLNETMNKSATIFGKMQPVVAKFASHAAKDLGLSKQAAMEAAASMGDMFLQLGFAGKEATRMSLNVVRLSADLGSFNNLPTADVQERISAAFRGEYDSLQALIPTISAATVQQRAMHDTGKKNAQSLTAQEKAAATLAIIMDSTGRAQGDFAKTSTGLANQQKILAARFEDVKAKLGAALLPAVQNVAVAVGDLFDKFEKSGAIDDAARSLKDFTKSIDKQKLSDTADSVILIGKAVGEVSKALGKWDKDNGRAFTTFGVNVGLLGKAFTYWKAKALDAMDTVASAMVKMHLLPKKFGDAVHNMRVKADQELKRLAEDMARQKMTAKLKADKRDAEAKIKDINRQLKHTNDAKVISKLKADKAQAEAAIRRVQGLLHQLDGKAATVWIRTHRVTYYGTKGKPPTNPKGDHGAFGGLIGPGGFIRRAGGGGVPGYSPNSRADNIPAMLTAGEYVQPVSAVRKYGEGGMNAIREGRATVSYGSNSGGGGNTYILNAPNYVGSTNDLRRALVDMARRGELDVVRR